MHIALDLSSMPVARVGAGHYMYHLARSLSEVDKNNSYTVLGRESLRPSLTSDRPNFVADFAAPESRPARLLWEQVTLPRVLAERGVDVLHSTHYTVPVVAKIKRVVTFHDMTFFLFPGLHTVPKRFFFREMTRISARLADAIIADSESTRNDIVRLLRPEPGKVITVPLGVSPAFQPLGSLDAIDRVRRALSLPDRFVLYVGTLEPRKNLPALVRAFRKLVDRGVPHSLVIAGRKGWMYQDLFRTIEQVGLAGRVLFTGYVPDSDLPALYNAAELFVYPSIYEGFGLPVLEAMACGTPVVTSNVSSMPEVAGDGAILVNPGDVEALANAMYRAITDRELREGMRLRGLERARLFSWERTARETLAVYERVMGDA